MHIDGRKKMDEHGRNAYRWLWVGEEIYGRTNKMTRYTAQLIDALRQSRKAFTYSDITWLLGRYVTTLYTLRPVSEDGLWQANVRRHRYEQKEKFNTEDSVQGPSARSIASTYTKHSTNYSSVTVVLDTQYGFYPNRLSAQFPKENFGFSGSRTWVRLLLCLTFSIHHNHHRHLSSLPAQSY